MKKHLFIFSILLLFQIIGKGQSSGSSGFLTFTPDGTAELTTLGASHFAQLALNCIQKEYPNQLTQVLENAASLKEPSEIHPAFYGCFDWHSAVHSHWMLVKLLKSHPNIQEAQEIRNRLKQNITPVNIAQEVSYFQNVNKAWERPYGWAWMLKLAEEAYTWDDPLGHELYNTLYPLVECTMKRFEDYLPLQKYPVREGTHNNSAFALAFAWDFANTTSSLEFKQLVEAKAMRFYLYDFDCPADWEPGGEDFLSPSLQEADLMQRILPKKKFRRWFKYFMPKNKLLSVARPAIVSDRSDPKTVHLDGLNISRAWAMKRIASKIKNRKSKNTLKQSAKNHLQYSLPNILSTHYEGAHWLSSFAVYALTSSKDYPIKKVVKP